MPKIKIFDPKSNFRLSLPVPYKIFVHCFVRESLIQLGINGQLKDLEKELIRLPEEDVEARKKNEKDQKQLRMVLAFVEALDFRALRMTLSDIDKYKGLVLVDIQSSDGTIVHITL